MARLKEMQLQLLTAAAAAPGAAGAAGVAAGAPGLGQDTECEALSDEVRQTYAKLAEVDPMRAGYYKDAMEGRAQVVMAPAAAASAN